MDEEAGDDERFLSHGMRELLLMLLMKLLECAIYEEEAGLAKEEEEGLGLYDARGLGWYEEHGLGEAEPPMISAFSGGLHPCNTNDQRKG